MKDLSYNMEDYIREYDGVLSQLECIQFRRFFHKYELTKRETDTYSFDELNISQTFPKEISYGIYNKLRFYIEQYKKDCDIDSSMFPEKSGFEELRMKRYIKQKDSFKEHVDVGNYASARRFLVCMIYLNTVEEGGSTYFTKNKKHIRTQAGKLLIFPSIWTHPHTGTIPESSDKYILSTYCHYL